MARKKSTTQSATRTPAAPAPVEPVSDTPASTSDTPESVSDTPVESVSDTPVESVSDTPASTSDTPEGGDTAPDAPVEETQPIGRARDEGGHFVADNKGTQPDESKAGEAAAKPVSDKAQTQAIRLVESYFGVGKVSKSIERQIIGALELGHQPCIVRNTVGNEKFSLRVFDTVFDKNDKTKDAAASSVVLNIARRLAHAGLYPTRG